MNFNLVVIGIIKFPIIANEFFPSGNLLVTIYSMVLLKHKFAFKYEYSCECLLDDKLLELFRPSQACESSLVEVDPHEI